MNYLNRGAAIGLLLGMASLAHASLVFEGLEAASGSGIGASNVVLTVQNTGTESGCIAWDGTVNVVGSTSCPGGLTPAITGGNEKVGNSQTQTQTVATTGVLNATYLVVILNATEPSGDSITVQNLSLSIYDPTNGAVLFNSGNLTGTPLAIPATDTGQGSLGFGFRLDPTQAALANPFIICGTCGNNHIGLAVLLTDAAGGNETLSVAFLAPEPMTWLTFATGLLALILFRRYRLRSRA